MDTTKPIKTYHAGKKVELFANRVEISTPGLFGKKEIIPIRNIASVEKPAMLNCIDITTNDGKKHRVAVSMNPKGTEEFKNLLLAQM